MPDWTQYAFMFPVAILVATAAVLSGVGGATLFVPIFVIGFPLLGPEFPLSTPASIGAALLTATFGFASGFVGYYRKGLIDFGSALPFIVVAAPVAVAGGLLLGLMREHELTLKAIYAGLMLALCPFVLFRGRRTADGDPPAPALSRGERRVVAADGTVYRYAGPRLDAPGALFTATGAFLTGLLGVGIGETVVPQLVRRHRIPVAVAAATSVFVVIATIASASTTQIVALMATGGTDAVPWHLVVYTVPGVLIGGQLGPWLQGRIPSRSVERGIAVLFAVIGVAMGWSVAEAL
jgi:uncharacterized membrane protein YfcA